MPIWLEIIFDIVCLYACWHLLKVGYKILKNLWW